MRKESFILSIRLFNIFLEYYASVVSAKSKRVADGSTHLAFLRLVESKVQTVVQLWILVALLMVDGRRYDVVLYAQHTSHSLYGTGSTQQVTCH